MRRLDCPKLVEVSLARLAFNAALSAGWYSSVANLGAPLAYPEQQAWRRRPRRGQQQQRQGEKQKQRRKLYILFHSAGLDRSFRQ